MAQHLGEFSFLAFGLVLLLTAVLSVPLARRVGLPAIVAYLIGGVIIGPSGLAVLATPALVGLFEQAAMRALDGVLAEGEGSVGSVVEITHLAPTPAGAEVTVRARLTAVDGREAWFDLEAEDARETVARGRHSRIVVEWARFERLLARKRP